MHRSLGHIAKAVAVSLMLCGAAIADDAPFTLPKLPYAFNALEPSIDARTMEIHHDAHHKAYVDNLNAKLKDYPDLKGESIEDILEHVSKYDAAVRNNAGGHYNHSLFWTILAPIGSTGEPSEKLAAQIKKDFGSQEAFVKQFSEAAAKNFGSGWTWLIAKEDGSLAITNTPNQDNPLMDVATTKGKPILGLDTWEHAYYLKYQNKRPAYIEAWWRVVNWKEVSRRFDD